MREIFFPLFQTYQTASLFAPTHPPRLLSFVVPGCSCLFAIPTLRYRARCTDIWKSVQIAPRLKPAVPRSRRNSQVQIFFRTLFLFQLPCRALLFLCRRSTPFLSQTI